MISQVSGAAFRCGFHDNIKNHVFFHILDHEGPTASIGGHIKDARAKHDLDDDRRIGH